MTNANDSVQTKSLESRTISAAGVEKAEPKAYKFTFEQLTAICNGKYNVGEIALDENGGLTKINNHVHLTSKNAVVTTPEQNESLRKQVLECIVDQNKSLSKEALDRLLRTLLGHETPRPLSRDELARILKSVKDGELENDFDQLNLDRQRIGMFKMGCWRNVKFWNATYHTQFGTRDDLINDMKVSGLIKGLTTDSGNQAVSQISVNMRHDFVWMSIKEMREIFESRALHDDKKPYITGYPLIRMKSNFAAKLWRFTSDDKYKKYFGEKTYQEEKEEREEAERVRIYEDDFDKLLETAENECNGADIPDDEIPATQYSLILYRLVSRLYSDASQKLNDEQPKVNEQPKVTE